MGDRNLRLVGSAAVAGSDNSALFGSFGKALCALANIERSKHNGPKREPRKLSSPCTTRAESGHRFLSRANQNIRRYLTNTAPTEGVGRVPGAMFLESSRLFTPIPPTVNERSNVTTILEQFER